MGPPGAEIKVADDHKLANGVYNNKANLSNNEMLQDAVRVLMGFLAAGLQVLMIKPQKHIKSKGAII